MFSNVVDSSKISSEVTLNPYLSDEIEVKNNKLDLVFEIFKQFSTDPLNELYGRNYWCEKDPHKSLKSYYITKSKSKKIEISPGCFATTIGDADLINTMCGVTYKGLMSALNGNNYEELGELNVVETNGNLDALINQILHNGIKLTPEIRQDFFSYGFSLDAAPMHTLDLCGSNHYSGHEFVVIQYLDEKNEIRYRFFQSFVIEYTLNEYLSKYKNDYSHEEFLNFLEELKNFISLKKWTIDATNFHKKYFHTKGHGNSEWVLPSGIPLEVKWKKNCVEDLITQKTHYELFKKSTFFPNSFIK